MSNPALYIQKPSSSELVVERQFTLANIYYVGSHQGCGCGFFKEGETNAEENAKIKKNYDTLAYYLSSGVLKGAKYQIYACWDGDQHHERRDEISIKIPDILKPEFEFKEDYLYNIG